MTMKTASPWIVGALALALAVAAGCVSTECRADFAGEQLQAAARQGAVEAEALADARRYEAERTSKSSAVSDEVAAQAKAKAMAEEARRQTQAQAEAQAAAAKVSAQAAAAAQQAQADVAKAKAATAAAEAEAKSKAAAAAAGAAGTVAASKAAAGTAAAGTADASKAAAAGAAKDATAAATAAAAGAASAAGTAAAAGTPAAGAAAAVNPADYAGLVAEIQTNKGTMVLVFRADKAPNHVKNFVDLARKGFYDGLKFHKIKPGYIIQGGDPKGDGSGGPGYQIKAEFNDLPHVRGSLSMARAGHPDSAGSQFFICHAAAPNLDGKYTVFGMLVKGMDTLDAIAATGSPGGVPGETVTISKVVIRPAQPGEQL